MMNIPIALVAVAIVVTHGLAPTAFAEDGEKSDFAVTFSEHVAPIVFQHCAECHRPGEAAPFSLTNFNQVRKHAKLIAEVAEDRYMPPWHARAGDGVKFRGERRLKPEEIAVLKKWAETGMAEGDPSKKPSLPKFPEGWQLGEPDLVLTMDKAFSVPAEGPDIYRHFALPTDLPEDKWIRAIEYRPGSRSVVHHALFFLDPTGQARHRDKGGRPGFNRMPQGIWENTLGGWAVGGNPSKLPTGMAYHLPKGSDILLQTHFHPTGKAEKEKSTLGLYFADKAPEKSFTFIQLPPLFGAINGIEIPAGSDDYRLKDSFELPVDVKAFSVSAHAHYLGREMKMTAHLPSGEDKVLLWISDWDFAWQEQYRYGKYIDLPKGTRLEAFVRYDNSSNNGDNPFSPPRVVKWGPMSEDEMGSVTLDITPVKPEDIETLKEAYREHIEDCLIDRFFNEMTKNRGQSGGGAPFLQNLIKTMDADGDGKLSKAEKKAIKAFMKANGMWDQIERRSRF